MCGGHPLSGQNEASPGTLPVFSPTPGGQTFFTCGSPRSSAGLPPQIGPRPPPFPLPAPGRGGRGPRPTSALKGSDPREEFSDRVREARACQGSLSVSSERALASVIPTPPPTPPQRPPCAAHLFRGRGGPVRGAALLSPSPQFRFPREGRPLSRPLPQARAGPPPPHRGFGCPPPSRGPFNVKQYMSGLPNSDSTRDPVVASPPPFGHREKPVWKSHDTPKKCSPPRPPGGRSLQSLDIRALCTFRPRRPVPPRSRHLNDSRRNGAPPPPGPVPSWERSGARCPYTTK